MFKTCLLCILTMCLMCFTSRFRRAPSFGVGGHCSGDDPPWVPQGWGKRPLLAAESHTVWRGRRFLAVSCLKQIWHETKSVLTWSHFINQGAESLENRTLLAGGGCRPANRRPGKPFYIQMSPMWFRVISKYPPQHALAGIMMQLTDLQAQKPMYLGLFWLCMSESHFILHFCASQSFHQFLAACFNHL